MQEAAQARIAALVDGNGINGRSVTVAGAREHDSLLSGHLDVAVIATSETRKSVGAPPPDSEICADSVDFNRRIRAIETAAASDAETISDLVTRVSDLPGTGWGANRAVISLGRPIRRFSYSETCQTCQGSTQAACQPCHGSGQQKCPGCQGTGHETCQGCFGKPIMGPSGPQLCQACHGSGLQQCRTCQGRTIITCQNCQSRGRVPCPGCKATGAITVTAKIDLSAQATFVIDAESLPEPLRPVFDKIGLDKIGHPGIASKITLVNHEVNDGHLRLKLAAELSWAQVDLLLGKRKLPVIIYGEKAILGTIPAILDRLIQPGIEMLRLATAKPATSAALVRKASQYRLLRLACQWAIKNPRAMIDEILAVYPQGISQKTLEQIKDYLRIILEGLTKQPRYQALGLCLAINALMAVGNVWLGWREKVLDIIDNPLVGVGFDIGLPLAGIGLTVATVSFVSQRALKFALPALFIGNGPQMADPAANPLGQVLLAGSDEYQPPQTVHGHLGNDILGLLLLIPVFHLLALQASLMLLHEAPDWYAHITHQNEWIEEKPPRRVGKNQVGVLEWNLDRLGLNPGFVDGQIDQTAQKAIMALEKAAGKPLTGQPSEINQQLAMVAIEDHVFLDYGTNPMALGPAISNRLRGRLSAKDIELASAALRSALHSLEVPISWINEENGHNGDITVMEVDNNSGCIRARHRLMIGLPQPIQGTQHACWSGSAQQWIFHPD